MSMYLLYTSVCRLVVYTQTNMYNYVYVDLPHVLTELQVSRIINYNVEQECNSFLRTKVSCWHIFDHFFLLLFP